MPTVTSVRRLPSYCHSCGCGLPVVSEAVKYRVLPTAVSSEGLESPGPGLMSLTRTVPAAVPSVPHSSWPYSPSVAEKYTSPPAWTKGPGLEKTNGE